MTASEPNDYAQVKQQCFAKLNVMNGLQISPGMEWVVLLLYLALGAGIVWQGFSQKKTSLAFAIWDITTIFYAALVVTSFLIYIIPIILIFVFVVPPCLPHRLAHPMVLGL